MTLVIRPASEADVAALITLLRRSIEGRNIRIDYRYVARHPETRRTGETR